MSIDYKQMAKELEIAHNLPLDGDRLNILEKELTEDRGFKLLMFLECVGGSLREFADSLLEDGENRDADES